MIKLKTLLFEDNIKTLHGSVIKRFKNNVGKQIGGSIYVHRKYAHEIIPVKILIQAINKLHTFNHNFRYNSIKWDVRANVVRFDESPDFDISREPHVGKYIKIKLNTDDAPLTGQSDNIWHHKWLWVKDDYGRFDVEKSKEWSKYWLSKFKEPAKGTDVTWNAQLHKYGLTENNSSNTILYGGIRSDGNIITQNASIKKGHSQEMGPNRWIYNQKRNTVFWHHMPDLEDKSAVTSYLEHRGYIVNSHRPMEDYYQIMNENKLLLESRATPKMLESFLKEMIVGSEWEGKVFLVGGFVRDELLGKEPKDADVVVGKFQGGVEFTTWLAKKLNIYKQDSNPSIFPTFGTANLRLDGVVWNGIDFTGETVDAVMFRKEQYHDPNSRKPTVQFTPDIVIDASRRDLTFNALYKDISSGKVLDPTGKGIDDLKNGVIRTPIDPTIIYTDDALRMFRTVRFATQLGFELSSEVIDGIKKNIHRLGNTSKERVRDELNKILLSKDPSRGIRLLRDTGLLPHVAKELQVAVGMTQNFHHVHDVFDHSLEVLKNTKPELVQRLMALFHDIGKTATRSESPTGVHFYGHEDVGAEIADNILRGLKYPTDIINAVKLGISNHMKLKHGGDSAVKLSDKSLRKFKIEVGDNLEHILDVIHADNIAHADASAMPNQIDNVRKRLQSLDVQVKKPNLPISGNDLIQLGIKPGPNMGKILSAITDAWFENPNISKEDAIIIARRMI